MHRRNQRSIPLPVLWHRSIYPTFEVEAYLYIEPCLLVLCKLGNGNESLEAEQPGQQPTLVGIQHPDIEHLLVLQPRQVQYGICQERSAARCMQHSTVCCQPLPKLTMVPFLTASQLSGFTSPACRERPPLHSALHHGMGSLPLCSACMVLSWHCTVWEHCNRVTRTAGAC